MIEMLLAHVHLFVTILWLIQFVLFNYHFLYFAELDFFIYCGFSFSFFSFFFFSSQKIKSLSIFITSNKRKDTIEKCQLKGYCGLFKSIFSTFHNNLTISKISIPLCTLKWYFFIFSFLMICVCCFIFLKTIPLFSMFVFTADSQKDIVSLLSFLFFKWNEMKIKIKMNHFLSWNKQPKWTCVHCYETKTKRKRKRETNQNKPKPKSRKKTSKKTKKHKKSILIKTQKS